MNKNLSELLADARGAPIYFQDIEVRAIYEVAVPQKSLLKVSFVKSTGARPQALRVKAENATLKGQGINVKDAIFWTDTAPREFDVAVVPSRGVGMLKMWNEWRDKAGTQNAWMGNAGMVVSTTSDGLLLKCSDGIGEPTFEDLVVQIRIVRNVFDFPAHREK